MASRERVIRPFQFKLDSYRLFITKQVPSAEEAFASAARMHNTTLSGCMTKYASSYMASDIKDAIRLRLGKNDPEAHAYFDLWKLEKKF